MPLIPPNDPQKASYANDKAALWREIRALWQATRGKGGSAGGDQEAVFSFAGIVETGTESPAYVLRYNETVTQITVSLGTAGSTATTVVVKAGGTTISTVTIDASSKLEVVSLSASLSENTPITCTCTTLGAGARNLTVQVQW